MEKRSLETSPCTLLSCPAHREGQFGMFDSVFFEVKTQASSAAQTYADRRMFLLPFRLRSARWHGCLRAVGLPAWCACWCA